MQTIDHRILGEFLENRFEDNVPDIFRRAFILGAVEPDWNLITYFHGWKPGAKLRGHNYENVLPAMRRLYESLQDKATMGLRDYYRLGKLTHYVADSFTYPHNGNFAGSLADHCAYEVTLHRSFSQMLFGKITEICTDIKSFGDIEELHEQYMQENGTAECDMNYILYAVSAVFDHVYSESCNKLVNVSMGNI